MILDKEIKVAVEIFLCSIFSFKILSKLNSIEKQLVHNHLVYEHQISFYLNSLVNTKINQAWI